MVAKKRKSKRQTLQQKYKIQKRTKEHHKRLKKGVLVSTGKKKTVDNHIPNAWPYKEDLLREIQAAKDLMEDVKEKQKEKRAEEMVRHYFVVVILVIANITEIIDYSQNEDKSVRQESWRLNQRLRIF